MTFKGGDQEKGLGHFKELINDSSIDEINYILVKNVNLDNIISLEHQK